MATLAIDSWFVWKDGTRMPNTRFSPAIHRPSRNPRIECISWLAELTRTFATNHPYGRFSHASRAKGDGQTRRVSSVLTARRAAFSQPKSGRTSAPFLPQARQVNSG